MQHCLIWVFFIAFQKLFSFTAGEKERFISRPDRETRVLWGMHASGARGAWLPPENRQPATPGHLLNQLMVSKHA